ncbi:MAG: hypothetical protein AB8G17_13745 [Gammaproteobacteria bacterium]
MNCLSLSLVFLCLCACTAVTPEPSLACQSSGVRCNGSASIAIVGAADNSAALLDVATAAARRFEQAFGERPANTAVVLGGSTSAEQNNELEAAGYPVTLPWITAADRARLQEQSVRQQVLEQTKTLPKALQEAALAQALATVDGQDADARANEIQAGALAHELGHLWFMSAFQPPNGVGETGHAYGGWAPDWLDETAAILLENATLTEQRRAHFFALGDADVIPLEQFLSMEHPSAQAAKRTDGLLASLINDDEQGVSRAVVLTGQEAEEFLRQSGGDVATNFYAQAQVFSDFLISMTNSTRVYSSLTTHLSAGGSLARWLAEQGRDWNLPRDTEQLGRRWRDWVAQNDPDSTP